GAGIGWTFAYRYPEYVQKLIAFNGPHPYTFMRELRTNKNQQKASEYMKWFQKQEAQDYMERDNFSGLRKLVIDPGIKKGYLTADDVQAYVNSWENGSVLSMLSYYRNLKIFTEEDLQRKSLFPLEEEVLNIPVQIIWGNQDPTFMPENLDGIEEYVPNISVHRLGEASHAPQHEKPHEVNDVMWNFLNK
ncbi:alpha/beta fold hydrolase, partial [Priestia megaterium]